jgi:hypothetical protein
MRIYPIDPVVETVRGRSGLHEVMSIVCNVISFNSFAMFIYIIAMIHDLINSYNHFIPLDPHTASHFGP